MDRRRVSDAWFYYKILNFLISIDEHKAINDLSTKSTEELIENYINKFTEFFIKKWAINHKKFCRSESCDETSKLSLITY